jgi:NitT/TauT family transport system permease protein
MLVIPEPSLEQVAAAESDGPPLTLAHAEVPREWPRLLVAGGAWLGAAALTLRWPDFEEVAHTRTLAFLQAGLGFLLVGAAASAGVRPLARVLDRLRAASAWLVFLALWVTGWQIVTAKLNLLPRPFFAPPQGILEVYADDWPRLLDSAAHSFVLLASGYLSGSLAGFALGVALGWSRRAAYWGHPVLRLIGPLPATAWLPIAFFAFPSSRSASIFLVALAAGVPVAVLTWSGVRGVDGAYYDIARTLGARPRFLVLRVAIPAALPHVFVGLFMGLCASFSVLVVAEMLGVKSGLGWYLSWAQGWAAYVNMYAALLLMAVFCSGLILLLFQGRDRLLGWQKGLLRW